MEGYWKVGRLIGRFLRSIGRLLEGLPLDWKVIGRLLEGFVGRALNGGRIFHFEVGGGDTLFDRSILHLGLYLEFYNADNQ